MLSKFKRDLFSITYGRLSEHFPRIQVLLGPRQVGKTTLARQIAESWGEPCLYCSVDEVPGADAGWLAQKWTSAEALARKNSPCLLIVDEVQKLSNWTEVVKGMWDNQKETRIKLLLLGSSQILLQKGLTESLAGRYELIPATHWSFREISQLHGVELPEYIFFGGYPGAYEFRDDLQRWRGYIKDSLVEPSLGKDILSLQPVDKIALFRRTFELASLYSGRELSYTKMLGQLQDAGNTVTIANYLDLLDQGFLISALQKYAGERVRRRGSSPKFQVYNNALAIAQLDLSLREVRSNGELWGRLVESAFGAYLLNQARVENFEVYYWRQGNHEVDFVVKSGVHLLSIEVKSGEKTRNPKGVTEFLKRFPGAKSVLVGTGGIALEKAFSMPIRELL